MSHCPEQDFSMASVKVAVRVRPFNKRELDMRSTEIIHMHENQTLITNVKLPVGVSDTLGRERVKQFAYDFSYCSTDHKQPHYVSQEQVFRDLGYDVVRSAFEGYNACVFAYGQTGSGKTYTMMGEPENYGLIPRICESLFSEMSDPDMAYRTEVSYLEIYNEHVHDLLREKNISQLNLKVREHPKEGPYVQDLSRHLVSNYGEIEGLIQQGNAHRTTAATHMNDQSSRSHAIFTIVFTQAKFSTDIPSEMHSKIHLVDLAGSERADSSGATGERLKEGSSINKSLVTLGNVISTLADMSDRATLRRHIFIPYRDSVLTWLLKDSLGGNSKTIMVATVSPADCNYAETLSTLRYAYRAKKIVNKPTVNEDPNVKLIRELKEENARLRRLLGTNVDILPSVKDFAETRERLNRNEEKVRQLTEKWTGKWQETANVLEEHQTLGLRKEGTSVVLDSELPYLLAIDDNILSTGMRLYHLKEGDTRVGKEGASHIQDISLVGPYIEPQHCIFRHTNGQVTLVPLGGALCSVSNVRIHEITRISQGSVIRLGRHHIFRFNHPGEAARLREELKVSGSQPMVKVWQDFQWSWSTTSDSALGSETSDADHKLCEEDVENLDEKRRELQQWEEEHCLAEAQRLADLAQQQAERQRLAEQVDDIVACVTEVETYKDKAEQAKQEILQLSHTVEEQVQVQLAEKQLLEEEQERLKKLNDKLERDKERARLERLKLRKKRELEKAKLVIERERQEEEWAQICVDKKVEEEKRKLEEALIEQKKSHSDRMRNLEKNIYRKNMADMRNLVISEVGEMCKMVGAEEFGIELPQFDGLQEDDVIDLEQLKFTVSPIEGPVISMHYLQGAEEVQPKIIQPEESIPLELTVGNVDTHLRYLSAQVTHIHLQVCEALQRKYSSVLSSDDLTSGLSQKVIDDFGNLKPLFEQLEKMSQNHPSRTALKIQLRDNDRLLSIVDKFLQIHEVLKQIDSNIKGKKFLRAIENLDAVHNLLSSLDAEEEIERNVQKVLQTEVCIMREKLLFDLGEMWNHLLKWSLPSEIRKRENRPRQVTLEVSSLEEDRKTLAVVVQAMYSVNMLDMRLRVFCERVMEHLVHGVVSDRNTLLQVLDELEKCALCVSLNPAGTQRSLVVPPAEAFQKLEQVFIFIHRPFSDIFIQISTAASGEPGRLISLMEKLGILMSGRLFECIYKECLSQNVPKSDGQWEKYNHMVACTEQFQEFLTQLKFTNADNSTLLDYLNNVNSLFANIKSQEILKKAHEFMTQELMSSIQISADFPLGHMRARDDIQRERFVKECRDQAGTANLKLPTCQISLPVRSLMCLAYDTLSDGVRGSSEGAVSLCQSVRNMFELYCDVVPSYHREKLNNLHLLAALHHNNCMFVAHHLITVDKMFRMKYPATDAMAMGKDPNLVELVPKVRRMGNESFSAHIDTKKSQMCDHLCEADAGFECVADDHGENAQRAVKQMLNHLKHISAIWQDVLPTTVYCRGIGSLLQAGIEEIISSVLSIEEFSADDCDYLQMVLQEIINFSPEYFRLSEEAKVNPQVALHEFVPCWMKFKELVAILSSSLQDVSDRWSDGKGPLSMHFTGEEVKKLVMAIFENTSKRDRLIRQLTRRPSVHLCST